MRDPRDPPVMTRDPYPQTEESIARAKAAQETERAEGIARLLAGFDGIDIDREDDHIRKRYAMCGLVAVRMAALGADQFRLCGLALHTAAQAAADLDAHHEHYPALDLLSEQNSRERKHWTQIASRAVESWQHVMGGTTSHEAKLLYFHRLYPGERL